MLVFCISSSNIKHAKENSTSLKISKEVKNIIHDKCSKDICVEIIQLVDYELKPCIGCGNGKEFIQKLWADANSHFNEVAELIYALFMECNISNN